MSVVVALLVTDGHNLDALYAALPAGTTVTTLELTAAEWSKPADRLASEYLLPMVARTQLARREAIPV